MHEEEQEDLRQSGRIFLNQQLVHMFALTSNNPELIKKCESFSSSPDFEELDDEDITIKIHEFLVESCIDHDLPLHPLLTILIRVLVDISLAAYVRGKNYDPGFDTVGDALVFWNSISSMLRIVLAGVCVQNSSEAWKYGIECLGGIKNIDECPAILADMKKLMDIQRGTEGDKN